MSTETLTRDEATTLAELEMKIERSVLHWEACSLALTKIRDDRLYRGTDRTFEDYVERRWTMSRARAYQLIRSGAVVANVNHRLTEHQARTLAPLAVADQSAALDAAGGPSATLAELEEAAAPFRSRRRKVRQPKPLTIRTPAGRVIVQPKKGMTHDQVLHLAYEQIRQRQAA